MVGYQVGDIVTDKYSCKKQIITKIITTNRVGTMMIDDYCHTYWNEWDLDEIEKTGDFFYITPLLEKLLKGN